MKAVADGGYGKELYRLSWGGSGSAEYQGYAESLRKTLAAEKGFREEFADYLRVFCARLRFGCSGAA